MVLRDDGLPRPTLPGAMKLTVLSPDRQKLVALIPDWEKECRAAGIVPGVKALADETLRGIEVFDPRTWRSWRLLRLPPDITRPNGTCIALLAEYTGKRAWELSRTLIALSRRSRSFERASSEFPLTSSRSPTMAVTGLSPRS